MNFEHSLIPQTSFEWFFKKLYYILIQVVHVPALLIVV